MKFAVDWLTDHLDTKLNDHKIIDKLTNIGLEVESFENQTSEFDDFIVGKIVNTEKHPNADRLRLCDVDIGKSETVKVICGAPNAKNNLYTVYAPPGTIIPKNQMKLSVSKIRGVTSYGMLCSESELNISNESEGIIDLNVKKYGDNALIKYEKKFSKVKTSSKKIKFTNNEVNKISKKIDNNLKKSIDIAFTRIKYFHSKQKFSSFKFSSELILSSRSFFLF